MFTKELQTQRHNLMDTVEEDVIQYNTVTMGFKCNLDLNQQVPDQKLS